MSDQIDEKARQLQPHPEVKPALDQAVRKEIRPVKVEKSAALWLVTHSILLLAFGALYYLLVLSSSDSPPPIGTSMREHLAESDRALSY